MNSEKTRELIARFHKDAENLVIHKLDAYPEMQLEYVQNVIKKEREAGRKIAPELLVLQMSLYCQLNPDLIIPQMEAYEYPLDNILLVCRQHKIDFAIAYVLVRLGSIQEAITIYVEIFKDKVRAIIKEVQYAHDLQVKVGNINQKSVFSNLFGLNKNDPKKVNGYLIAKEIAEKQFDEEVKKIVNICVQNNKFDSSDEIWYILLDSILWLKDNMIENREGQSFLKDNCT